MNMNLAPLPLCILEEIGLEGLEGITIEGLWKRISIRCKIPLPLNDRIKSQIWEFVFAAKCFRFYSLPEERETLKLFDRIESIDPFFGGTEADSCPYNVFKYNPISKDGNRGSCESYETRQEVSTEEFYECSIEDIEEKFGRHLVIVAAQSIRDSLLIPPTLPIDIEINISTYCILERLGRARYNGELAQGKFSLSDIGGDPVTFHFQKKKLMKYKLIECQLYSHNIDGTNMCGQLYHLPRFYAQFKPRHMMIIEKIIDILKAKPNFMAEYHEVKSHFDANTSNFLRRFFKTSFYTKYVLTDARVPYRAIYPNAKEKDWKMKNLGERTLHVLQLKNPNVDSSEFWLKHVESNADEDSDDENSDRAPIHWKEISSTFTPRKQIPVFKQPETSGDENFDEIDVFSLLFPRSLYMWIADCTNERLKLLEMKTKKQYPKTDYQEIMLVIGVTLMMSYNRVPRMSMYWSKNKWVSI